MNGSTVGLDTVSRKRKRGSDQEMDQKFNAVCDKLLQSKEGEAQFSSYGKKILFSKFQTFLTVLFSGNIITDILGGLDKRVRKVALRKLTKWILEYQDYSDEEGENGEGDESN